MNQQSLTELIAKLRAIADMIETGSGPLTPQLMADTLRDACDVLERVRVIARAIDEGVQDVGRQSSQEP